MCWHCITVESYCSKLERLQQVICCTQPGMLHQHFINFHDNARPHNPNQTCGWEVTDNPPPNSPILMTSNFRLFMKLLPGEKFATDTDVKQAVTYWLKTLYDDFFYSGTLSRLSVKVGKCLNVNCHYVEFWCLPPATHVPCILWSQKKMSQHQSTFYLIFWNFLYI